jgi:transposase InsO family protein
MQRQHIRAAGRKKKYPPSGGPEHTRFPNLLNRQFNANKPMSKIVTDITQFGYQGIRYYFTCFLDLYNNEILEWNVGQTEALDFIMTPLRNLLKRKKMSTNDPMLLHSDQGSQYSSAGLTSLLAQYNVTQSMSRSGTPHDNAVIESIFGWFKEFLRYDYLKHTQKPVSEILNEAIYDFNHYRPSHKLKYKSPVQFRIEQGFV